MIEEQPEPYHGPMVVIEPVEPLGYRVRLELSPGDDLARTSPSKDEAWSWAMCLWSAFKLPLRDATDGNVAREFRPGPRK